MSNKRDLDSARSGNKANTSNSGGRMSGTDRYNGKYSSENGARGGSGRRNGGAGGSVKPVTAEYSRAYAALSERVARETATGERAAVKNGPNRTGDGRYRTAEYPKSRPGEIDRHARNGTRTELRGTSYSDRNDRRSGSGRGERTDAGASGNIRKQAASEQGHVMRYGEIDRRYRGEKGASSGRASDRGDRGGAYASAGAARRDGGYGSPRQQKSAVRAQTPTRYYVTGTFTAVGSDPHIKMSEKPPRRPNGKVRTQRSPNGGMYAYSSNFRPSEEAYRRAAESTIVRTRHTYYDTTQIHPVKRYGETVRRAGNGSEGAPNGRRTDANTGKVVYTYKYSKDGSRVYGYENRRSKKKKHRTAVTAFLSVAVVVLAFAASAFLMQAAFRSSSASSGGESTGTVPAASGDMTEDPGQTGSSDFDTKADTEPATAPDTTAQTEAPPETAPPVTVGSEYFEHTVFIGNSLMEGFMLHVGPENARYFTVQGMTVTSAIQEEFSVGGQKKVLLEALKSDKSFGYVYLMFGINEMGWVDYYSFKQRYGELIERIRGVNPDCVIYIQSVLPVTKKLSDESNVYNIGNITLMNSMLRDLAEEKSAVYLDIYSAVAQPDGYLPEDAAASDGVHLKKEYCQKWLDYIQTHAEP